ncbi:MAG: hypothetical protein EOO09_20015 [Chitinophagaceae bacterium]|nr:MAG: hypothetical protein EOO09_20015 [Chitinophagaceae bacterium]
MAHTSNDLGKYPPALKHRYYEIRNNRLRRPELKYYPHCHGPSRSPEIVSQRLCAQWFTEKGFAGKPTVMAKNFFPNLCRITARFSQVHQLNSSTVLKKCVVTEKMRFPGQFNSQAPACG